jgi:hypothetical protein
MNHDELVLWRKDYATILVVLDGKPIPGLETLRELLEEANSGVTVRPDGPRVSRRSRRRRACPLAARSKLRDWFRCRLGLCRRWRGLGTPGRSGRRAVTRELRGRACASPRPPSCGIHDSRSTSLLVLLEGQNSPPRIGGGADALSGANRRGYGEGPPETAPTNPRHPPGQNPHVAHYAPACFRAVGRFST